MNRFILKGLILQFIEDNFGKSERENPCYNVDLMVDYILENYDKCTTIGAKEILKQYKEDCFVRHCNECGKEMWEGYCIDNGLEYYCCADCLDKNYTEEEWEDLYATGDSYYTDWFEEQEEYNKLKESE